MNDTAERSLYVSKGFQYIRHMPCTLCFHVVLLSWSASSECWHQCWSLGGVGSNNHVGGGSDQTLCEVHLK